jgi:hypothetical protein
MHVILRWLLPALAFSAGACDRFDPVPGLPPPSSSAAAPTAVDSEEARALGRAVLDRVLAYARRCDVDTCPFFGEARVRGYIDLCPIDADAAKGVAEVSDPFVAHVEAHPGLAGRVKTVATHVRLFSAWLSTATHGRDTHGVLEGYQKLALAFNAWQPDRAVETDPAESAVCSADPRKRTPVSYLRYPRPWPWSRCDGIPCLPYGH